MKKPSKEKVLGLLWKLLKISIILAVIILVAFIFSMVTTDKYAVSMNNTSEYSQSSDFESTYVVKNVRKYGNNNIYTGKELNVKAELLNDNMKKVSKVKTFKDKVYAEQSNSIHLDIPDNLEDGRYNVRVKVRRFLVHDTFIIPINISSAGDIDVTTSFDKGIYKPGDNVKYRLLLTDKIQNKPIEEEILVNILDGNDNKVYTNKVKTSDFGIISGEFQLGDEVNSGNYKFNVYVGNSLAKSDSFYVEPYEQPLFEVIASPEKEVFKTTDEVRINVGANYFFGESLQTAKKIAIKNASGAVKFERENYTFDGQPVSVGLGSDYPGKNVFTVEVTDNSNYIVEKTITMFVCDDDIQIEALPEFGKLVSGTNNTIYIITKTPKGEPVETIGTIQGESIKKDFATNANGIGVITISEHDVRSFGSSNVVINAQNAEGATATKTTTFDYSQDSRYVKTNKSVYSQGEDILLSYASTFDSDQVSIVIKKGEKILKTISTGNGEETINLGDNYGIIDIVLGDFSRTIFVKPNKDLKLVASTNSTEYKPGDEMKLSISSEGVNGKEDTALLISILDKANLSLRDNDLTIDNIKLALADIKLSDGFTAADLYAAIVANKSEADITALLLRTEVDKNVTVNTETRSLAYENSEKLEGVIYFLVMYIILFIIILIIKVISDKIGSSKFDITGLKKVCTVACTALVLSPIWFVFDNIFGLALLIIATIYAYRKFSVKYKDIIFATCIDTAKLIIVVFLLTAILFFGARIIYYLVEDYFSSFIEIVSLVIPMIICIGILVSILKAGNRGFRESIKNLFYMIIKSGIIGFLTYVVMQIADDNISYSYDYAEMAMFLIFVASVLGWNFLFVRKQKIKAESNVLKVGAGLSAGLILLVIVLLGFSFILSIVKNFSSNVTSVSHEDTMIQFNDAQSKSTGGGMSRYSAMDTYFSDAEDTTGAASSIDSIFNFNSFAKNVKPSNRDVEEYENDITETAYEDATEPQTATATPTQKIRTVFLESLAFLPDVIAKDGYAEETIQLSDNITTWKIQVVGNTKNGEIGYTSEEFKVFKDFFVNYTTPNNLKVGDSISLPVTVYNYTAGPLEVTLDVKENDWCKLERTNFVVTVDSNGTQLVYIPIEITKAGDNALRIDAKSGSNSDIIEKTFNVNNKGYKIEEVRVNGYTKENVSETINMTAKHVEGSEKVKVKIYPNNQSQIIENIDSMLKLPTGCFEQVSSSLYPDILILQYLNESKESNDEIKEKALEYINKGYQKLLTYEVPGEKGGYSLYGHSPAKESITAYGLLEFSELEKVYEIDEHVIENMVKFLEKKTAFGTDGDYTTWCIVESGKASTTLINRCEDYIKDNIEDENNLYNYALLTAAYNRIDPSAAEKYVKNLITKVKEKLDASSTDVTTKYYYRNPYSYYSNQTVEIYSLLSMILSDNNSKVKDNKLNEKLIENIYKSKDSYSWGSTQKAAFALRAINQYNSNGKLEKQTLNVTFGNDTKEVKIDDDILSFYEFEFTNVDRTNTFSINGVKSNMAYEAIASYNVEPNDIEPTNKFMISRQISNIYNVNDVVNEEIKVTNNSGNDIMNGIVEVEIPTGFKVLTNNLDKLVYEDSISKYEYNNETIKLYVTEFKSNQTIIIPVAFRASYPVKTLSNTIKVYDYYAPEVNEVLKPIEITVNE